MSAPRPATVPSAGRILIIGAGPCGLACARELERHGHTDWLILEQADHPGGLASSVVDPAGFTWDLGGHVVFSHYREFDAVLEETMGPELISHDRSSFIRVRDRWIPYPFQNNLHHLPNDVAAECLSGLARAPGANGTLLPFSDWMRAVFGEGITRHFMEPYNLKVWATPAEQMAADWIAERISVVDYQRVLRNFREGRDDLAWGPNNRFVFPSRGATGEIYRRLAASLPPRIHYRRSVVEVDAIRRRLRTAGGEVHEYDALVSTMPLDRLVAALTIAPGELRAAAANGLRHNSVYMVGVGYRAPLQDDKSWMYFPEPSVPFYRVTNFAKYAPANVPGGEVDKYCSYMTETAHSPEKPASRTGLEQRVERGLRAAGVVDSAPEVSSIHVEDLGYAYPVPTRSRNAALATIQPWLMENSIFSRGRFGAWRYEIGNMDHATKMGIDVAHHMLGTGPEELWRL